MQREHSQPPPASSLKGSERGLRYIDLAFGANGLIRFNYLFLVPE